MAAIKPSGALHKAAKAYMDKGIKLYDVEFNTPYGTQNKTVASTDIATALAIAIAHIAKEDILDIRLQDDEVIS